MRESDFKEKVSVFISSNINEKYRIIRESLNLLLLQTCMCTTYCFEEEPASSTDVVSSYLYNIDRSDLIVFLIDNADGIGDGTLKEVKRSRDLKKKCIFLFCNENNKEKTELQKEIMSSTAGEKYLEVSKLSHMAEAAYHSVLSDIIDIYLRYCGNHFRFVKEKSGEFEPQEAEIGGGQTIINKSKDRGQDYSKSVLTGFALYDQKNVEIPSDVGFEIGELLRLLLGEVSFSSYDFSSLKKKLLDFYSTGNLKKVVQCRLDALECFLGGRIEDALTNTIKALEIAQKAKNIPTWIVNDIAIDIRNISFEINQYHNVLSFDNKGQEVLDASEEPVYYPIVDRAASEFYKKSFEDLLKEIMESPFTVNLGGADQSLHYLVELYTAALLYGSITHIDLVKVKLSSYLEYLSIKTRSHKVLAAAIQILLLIGDSKKLEEFLKHYGEYTDSITEVDVINWANAVETIGIKHKRLHSKMLLLAYFGYYFPDEDFDNYFDDIKARFRTWIDEQYAGDMIAKTYLQVLTRLNHRINPKEQVETAFLFSRNNLRRWYDDLFKMLSCISASELKKADLDRYVRWLGERCDEDSIISNCHYLPEAIQALRLQIEVSELDDAVKKAFPNYYENTYSLNVFEHNIDEIEAFLQKQIESIHRRNESQGKNGCYSGYAYNPYKTIGNIVIKNHEVISEDCRNRISAALIETLEKEKQSYEEKCSAIELLCVLLLFWKGSVCIKNAVDCIAQNKDKFVMGQDVMLTKGYSERLYRSIVNLVEIRTGTTTEMMLVNYYSQLSAFEASETILYLGMMRRLTENYEGCEQSFVGLNSFMQYLFEVSQSDNNTIRCLAYICMLNIMKSKEDCRAIILEYVSHAMDSETYDVKIAIVSRIVKLDGADSLVEYIIQKGKADSHYYVRKISERK